MEAPEGNRGNPMSGSRVPNYRQGNLRQGKKCLRYRAPSEHKNIKFVFEWVIYSAVHICNQDVLFQYVVGMLLRTITLFSNNIYTTMWRELVNVYLYVSMSHLECTRSRTRSRDQNIPRFFGMKKSLDYIHTQTPLSVSFALKILRIFHNLQLKVNDGHVTYQMVCVHYINNIKNAY